MCSGVGRGRLSDRRHRVGGTEEMLVDGESAVLVPPDRAAAAGRRDRPTVRRRHGLASNLARAARAQVVEQVLARAVARGLAKAWQLVL